MWWHDLFFTLSRKDLIGEVKRINELTEILKPSAGMRKFTFSTLSQKEGMKIKPITENGHLEEKSNPESPNQIKKAPENQLELSWMMCRLAEWFTFLHTSVMATVVMCRVRNPACTAASALGKERYINGWQEAPLTLCIWRYINEVHLHSTFYIYDVQSDNQELGNSFCIPVWTPVLHWGVVKGEEEIL